MAAPMGPIYARVYDNDDLGTLLTLNGTTDIAVVAGEITRVRNGMGEGWAEFPYQTGLDAFLTNGRVVSLRHFDDTHPDNGANLGAFVIRRREENLDGQVSRASGPDLLEELAKTTVWQPIGTATATAVALTGAIAAPFAGTIDATYAAGRDLLLLDDDGTIDDVEVGDEVRLTLDDTTEHVSVVTSKEGDLGDLYVKIRDKTPSAATDGNAIEFRRRRVRVGTSGAAFTTGTKVVITLNSGTHTTLCAANAVWDGDLAMDIAELEAGVTGAANNGNTITATDYSAVTTSDVTQIMGYAPTGWTVEFETGTGTAAGTAHPPDGASVLDLLIRTAERTGEFFRLASPASDGDPYRKIKWRRTPDRAGISVDDNVYFQTATNAATWESNLYAIIDDPGYTRESEPFSRLHPIPGDTRLSLALCTSTAISAAAARGYDVVSDSATLGLWGIPYVKRTAEDADAIKATTQSFNHIKAGSENPTELRTASDQMLYEAMDWLDAHSESFRPYLDATAYVHEAYAPGNMVDFGFASQGFTVALTSDAAALVIDTATYYAGRDEPALKGTFTFAERTSGGNRVQTRASAEKAQARSMRLAKDAAIMASGGVGSQRSNISVVNHGGAGPHLHTEYELSSGNAPISVENRQIFGRKMAWPLYNAVTDYGMKSGAAAAINRAALQSAVDAAVTAGGAIVYIPKGTYSIDTGITLSNHVHLQGQGWGKTTLQKSGTDTTTLLSYAPGSGNVDDIVIEGLTVTNTSANASCINLEAVTASEVKNVYIRDCYVKNTYDGQTARCLTIKRRPKNVHITGCVFEGCASPTTNESRMTGQYTVAIISDDAECLPEHTVFFHNNTVIGGQIGLNLTANSNPPGVTAALDMRGCEFTGQTMIGTRLYHGQNYKILGNNWHDIAAYPTAAWLDDVTAHTGTAATGTLTSTVATTSLTGWDEDYFIGWELRVTSGTRSGETSTITDSNVTNGQLTFSPALTGAMANGDTFTLIPEWCGEPAALWADTIFTSGSADQYRGRVLTIANNLFSYIEGTALFLEEPQNVQIANNSISFITERTSATVSSIGPTGYTSAGGVGIFVSGGRSQPLITGNQVHYCEHAAIRINRNFVSIPEGPQNVQITGNQLWRCTKYGVRIDGHLNTTVTLNANTIQGNDDATPEAGVYVDRAGTDASEGVDDGIARLVVNANTIEGFDYGVQKTYVRTPVAGMTLHAQGNDIYAAEWPIYWESAAGSVVGNNIRAGTAGQHLKLSDADGEYVRALSVFQNGDGVVPDYTVYRRKSKPFDLVSGIATGLILDGNVAPRFEVVLKDHNGVEGMFLREVADE